MKYIFVQTNMVQTNLTIKPIPTPDIYIYIYIHHGCFTHFKVSMQHKKRGLQRTCVIM